MWSFRYLRQEFRELELLDEISKLRYEGNLPNLIEGNFRNPLIRAYQKWKGTDYVPPLTHPALQWSVKDPLPFLPVITDAPWQIIDKKKKKKLKLRLQLRSNPQIFSLDLLQLKAVSL